ncbi:MAG: hypothetical protein ISF22_03670 [Methanomassiliicoccus sp.]|nr:hypothetical protein [Methanomassiliicoccus sp.]
MSPSGSGRGSARPAFKAANIDVAIALVATFLLPVACHFLLRWTGALLPLALYYGAFCVSVVLWRKGSLQYVRPRSWAWPLFLVLLAIQLVAQACAALTVVPVNDPLPGVVLTLLIWVPINALAEQLLWVYIFEAFGTRWVEGIKRTAGMAAGVLMTVVFVGLIHAIFWGEFLPGFESVFPLSQIFFASQFVMTVGYLLLFRRTGSMVPLFLLHIIADATLVVAAMYSIVPDLFL